MIPNCLIDNLVLQNPESEGKPQMFGHDAFSMKQEIYAVGDAVYFDPEVLNDQEKPDYPTNVPSYVTGSGRDHKVNSNLLFGTYAGRTVPDRDQFAK